MRTIIPDDARLIPAEAERVFAGKIFDVFQWQQKQFDGSYATFEMLRRPDTVNVFAIKDGRIVILRQRQPNTGWFYGVPGGRHDDERETELDAAKRELLEETGLSFDRWELIDIIQPISKIEWFIYTFLATEFAGETEPNLDAGEEIKVELKTLDQVRALAAEAGANSRADLRPEILDKVARMMD